MNAVWLVLLGSLLVGSAVVAVIETQESSGASGDGPPGLIENVREIAGGVDDEVGAAVSDVGDFITGFSRRLTPAGRKSKYRVSQCFYRIGR